MFVKRSCDDKTDKIIEDSTKGHVDDSFLSVLVALVVFYVGYDCLAWPFIVSGIGAGAAALSDENYCDVYQGEIDLVQLPSDDAGCL